MPLESLFWLNSPLLLHRTFYPDSFHPVFLLWSCFVKTWAKCKTETWMQPWLEVGRPVEIPREAVLTCCLRWREVWTKELEPTRLGLVHHCLLQSSLPSRILHEVGHGLCCLLLYLCCWELCLAPGSLHHIEKKITKGINEWRDCCEDWESVDSDLELGWEAMALKWVGRAALGPDEEWFGRLAVTDPSWVFV